MGDPLLELKRDPGAIERLIAESGNFVEIIGIQ